MNRSYQIWIPGEYPLPKPSALFGELPSSLEVATNVHGPARLPEGETYTPMSAVSGFTLYLLMDSTTA